MAVGTNARRNERGSRRVAFGCPPPCRRAEESCSKVTGLSMKCVEVGSFGEDRESSAVVYVPTSEHDDQRSTHGRRG